VLLGCTTSTVIGGDREIVDAGGLSLWAARGVDAVAHRLPGPLPEGGRTLLMLGDPYSFDVDALLAGTAAPVIGGMASAGRGPGGNRLLLDDALFTDGAVAVSVPNDALTTVVSQGCRPIGRPLIVTKGEGSLVHELAGQPALARVQSMLDGLPPSDRSAASSGLYVGLVIDESKASFGPGDFLVRNLLGGDKTTGAIAIAADVAVGSTIQLQVRDARTADEELQLLLTRHSAASALLFTCTARGVPLFGEPDHDATTVAEMLGPKPLAGMACAAEIGPVAGRSFLHTYTASLALFRS
jgi:small ligand-binding sensory domain FIST